MKYLWILLVFGCGPRFQPVYQCHINGLGEYLLEFEINCDMVQAETDIAFQVLDTWGLVPKSEQDVFSYVKVKVFKVQCIEDDDSGDYCTRGWYSSFPDSHIDLGFQRIAILHELLHHWDTVHLALGTIWHEDWDENDYYRAINWEFRWRILLLWESYGYSMFSYPE